MEVLVIERLQSGWKAAVAMARAARFCSSLFYSGGNKKNKITTKTATTTTTTVVTMMTW